ncbi:hypothetical protein JXB02_05785 [Candidatus Woesearchaeota archaeon]|nr:hypothetical protein [Candidatus Woesearchaeota archaeon]
MGFGGRGPVLYAAVVVSLLLVQGCDNPIFGQAVLDVDRAQAREARCVFSYQLQPTEIDGLRRLCLQDGKIRMLLEYDFSNPPYAVLVVVGTGSGGFNVTERLPAERRVFHLDIPYDEERFGSLRSVRLYPVGEAEGRQYVCEEQEYLQDGVQACP